ncbi:MULTISPECIES: hypothetical protein [unclassified Arsukibacterium]|uniref:hypothetical protein n=1 Tax=unclassified Arsukibacterium TaxID=2635278 RepID=UPI000C4B27EC|nr:MULTISPECIES: hypothetical protein [unclassified Arsukibacterium]MAA93503.1 hypothetical protein [Rheinheimera sp.]MBM33015.1 hypothetical protein [Rheinheimera sp.]HAW92957.1 hypothetical protein [Candidatus Azambacteria bacterium]|tara:strand:- start:116743 stop:118029 length:1287 start_codon:yes stop_codon:yes gene_type:complete
MSRWNENFKNHIVHKSVADLDNLLSSRERDHDDGATAEVRRARKVIELIKGALNGLDPEVTPTNMLDSLNSQLQERYLVQYLTAFAGSGSIDHIQAANEQLAPILQPLTWLVPYAKRLAVRSHAKSLENTIDIAISNLEAKKSTIENSLTDLDEKMSELADTQDKLDSTMELRKSEMDQQISMWQQQFSDSQEKRLDNYNNWKEKVETDIKVRNESLIDKLKTDVEVMHDGTESELIGLLGDAKAKYQNILDLYQLSSGDSISGGYAKSASDENKSADIWRLVSIGFIIASVAWLIIAYCQITGISFGTVPSVDNIAPVDSQFNWQRFIVSFSLTGVLLFGAGYAGQQSNKHREEGKAARTFALQIKALDPFIHSLEPDIQAALKKQLTPTFFAGYQHNDVNHRTEPEKNITELTKAISELIRTAKGN